MILGSFFSINTWPTCPKEFQKKLAKRRPGRRTRVRRQPATTGWWWGGGEEEGGGTADQRRRRPLGRHGEGQEGGGSGEGVGLSGAVALIESRAKQ